MPDSHAHAQAERRLDGELAAARSQAAALDQTLEAVRREKTVEAETAQRDIEALRHEKAAADETARRDIEAVRSQLALAKQALAKAQAMRTPSASSSPTP